MDVFSAGALGLHTVTRFAVFLILQASMRSLNYNRDHTTLFIPLGLFIGTLLMHLLLLISLLLRQDSGQVAFLSIELAFYQAIINTVVGVPIIMLLRKLDGIPKT